MSKQPKLVYSTCTTPRTLASTMDLPTSSQTNRPCSKLDGNRPSPHRAQPIPSQLTTRRIQKRLSMPTTPWTKATRKSTTGGVIFLNGGPISWSSRQQKIVAQSTAEAEIIAATEVTKEVVHIKLLLTELGVRKTDAPILVNEDNQACILMGNGMKSSRAAKHYEVRLHFLQESIKSKVIRFKYCPTDAMIADCLTKPLDTEKFIYFRDMLLK